MLYKAFTICANIIGKAKEISSFGTFSCNNFKSDSCIKIPPRIHIITLYKYQKNILNKHLISI